MTAKDKKLIVIAGGVLLAFAIIMFGIKPGFTGWMESKDTKAELSAKKTTMETEIKALPTYQSQLTAVIADYNTTAARVYGDLTNDTIQDAVVNELVSPCGLAITSFNINEVSTYQLPAFTGKVDENGNTVAAAPSEGGAAIKVANVTVNVFGTTDQIVTFINSLNANEGIHLIQTSFTNGVEQTTVTVSFLMVLSETF